LGIFFGGNQYFQKNGHYDALMYQYIVFQQLLKPNQS
jgi:hypothetical protein